MGSEHQRLALFRLPALVGFSTQSIFWWGLPCSVSPRSLPFGDPALPPLGQFSAGMGTGMVPNPWPGSCTKVGPDPDTFWPGTAPWGTQLLTPAASVPALLQFPWYPSQHQGCKGSQIACFRAFEENIWTGGDFFFLPKAVNVSVKEGSLKDSRETKK